MLDNEIEILRTTMENKEQLLQKCALVQSHKVMERDTLRQDFGKQVHMQTELSAELEQQVRGVQLASVLKELLHGPCALGYSSMGLQDP